MPRIIRKTERHPRFQSFTKRLVEEFKTPGESPQPLIVEDHAPAAKSRTVYVIWDEWDTFPLEDRFDIILDAYRQVEGVDAAAEVTDVAGLTAEDALVQGLLPYQISFKRRKNDRYALEAFHKALSDEAAHTVLGADADQLRYVRLEDAEKARKRLTKALPGSIWVVQHQDEFED